MLERLSPRARFNLLVAEFEPLIQSAFLDAIADIRSKADIVRAIEFLERKDIVGALAALHISTAAFRPLERAIATAFEGGGVGAVAGMPRVKHPNGGLMVLRFDARNIVAENVLRTHWVELSTRITDDMIAGIQNELAENLAQGLNPRTSIRRITGPIGRSGAREGGLIGLSRPQMEYLATARAELLSGDPKLMRNYLQRGLRDKRLDRIVVRALKDGKPVNVDTIGRAATSYSNRMLAARAELIAQQNTTAAIGMSQKQAFAQAVQTGAVRPDQIEKVWHTARDGRVRDSHSSMQSQRVGVDQSFVTGSGVSLDFPGDPSAPIEETARCRCWSQYRINHLKDVR